MLKRSMEIAYVHEARASGLKNHPKLRFFGAFCKKRLGLPKAPRLAPQARFLKPRLFVFYTGFDHFIVYIIYNN
ncbi:hypothetical protein HanPSC8_Chr17g0787651 [Helianthus annuus]|nr:hypothetical protein HanPSC8_Chr17g0787651 [Helianthus annuus]